MNIYAVRCGSKPPVRHQFAYQRTIASLYMRIISFLVISNSLKRFQEKEDLGSIPRHYAGTQKGIAIFITI